MIKAPCIYDTLALEMGRGTLIFLLPPPVLTLPPEGVLFFPNQSP